MTTYSDLFVVAQIGSQTPKSESPTNSIPGHKLSSVSPSPLHALSSPGNRNRLPSACEPTPLFESVVLSSPPSLSSQPSFNPLSELPPTVPTREEWTKDEEVAACVVCHEHFSLVRTMYV